MYDMRDITTWMGNNKEWVFSGIGVFVIGLIGGFFKLFRSTDKGGTHNASITQSPSVTQTPVINITNNAVPNGTPQPLVAKPRPTNQASLFAVNPLVVTRDIRFVSGLSEDATAQVCVARFKMHDRLVGRIQDRFEGSIEYVERLSASGMPYERRPGHVNLAQWLSPSNDIQELILVIQSDSAFFAAKQIDGTGLPGSLNLVELDLVGNRFFASVTLTDLTNGQKLRAEYFLTFDPYIKTLTVRQTTNLH